MISGINTTASHHMMFQKNEIYQPHKAYAELKMTVTLSILLLSLAERNLSIKTEDKPALIQVIRPINTGIVFAVKKTEKMLSGLAA